MDNGVPQNAEKLNKRAESLAESMDPKRKKK